MTPEAEKLREIDIYEIYDSWREISRINDSFIDGRPLKGDSQEMKDALEAFIKGTKKAIEIIESAGY